MKLTLEELTEIQGHLRGCPRLTNCGRSADITALLAHIAALEAELAEANKALAETHERHNESMVDVLQNSTKWM
jgi:DNA-binding FrmR family transcriptional regulator